jgi:hypothetical protein
MKLAAFTSGDINMASSRLRSYYLFRSNAWKDHEVVFNPSVFSINSFHWLHIQKMYAPRYVLLALYARIMGKFVVFDLDDESTKLTHRIAIYIMFKLSNIVATDSELKQQYFIKKYKQKNITVIPEPMDVEEQNVSAKKISRFEDNSFIKKRKSVIMWVGNVGNFNSFKSLIESDKRFFDYEIIIVTDISTPSNVELNHPNYKIKQWSISWVEDIDFNIRYYMLLNHNDKSNINSSKKNENKMVMAIYNQIIPIVSDTFFYSKLAKNLNAEYLVFNENKNPYDLINDLEAKDSDWVESFFEKSSNFIQNNYNRHLIGAKLLRIYQNSSSL